MREYSEKERKKDPLCREIWEKASWLIIIRNVPFFWGGEFKFFLLLFLCVDDVVVVVVVFFPLFCLFVCLFAYSTVYFIVYEI